MVYEEKLVSAANGANEMRGARQYRRCDAVIKIDKGSTKARLRDDRRLIAVAADKAQVTMFSPSGPLSQEELDLIEIPASSLLVERLLPDRPVVPGDRWQHEDSLVAALLNLDAISESDVATVFKEATPAAAQLELTGTVHGAIDGVSTEIELKGRYKFDLKLKRITWLALLIKEKRGVGHVAPGVDVTARLQLKITPGAACPALADQELADVNLDPQSADTLLEYVSQQGQFQFLYDRAWHVVNDTAQSVALRLVDRGELIAQCNISAVPAGQPGKRFTLAKFQDDVERSLGDHFERFVSAAESSNSAGQDVCRVIAAGAVDKLPIQWNYHLVADSQGHQAVLAFTMEAELVERFAASDQPILASLRFVSSPASTASQQAIPSARK
jgi:hypothetical protein